MRLQQFIARHCFDKVYRGNGVFQHTGYSMDPPNALRIPSSFELLTVGTYGNQRIWRSDQELAILTVIENDITIVKFGNEKDYKNELESLSAYYDKCRHKKRSRDHIPFHEKNAQILL